MMGWFRDLVGFRRFKRPAVAEFAPTSGHPPAGRPRADEREDLPSLAISNLTTHFFMDLTTVQALRGFTLAIEQGEMFGLVGGAGSGKSVLVKSIMGLIQPPGQIISGEVLLFGEDLRKKSPAELDRIRGSDLTLIASNARSSLHPLYPVGEQIVNVLVAHRLVSHKEARRIAIGMLEEVGIDTPVERMRAYPHELSGGMAQRVAIAMALINSPRVIIADEPAGGLDVTIRAQVLQLMVRLIRDHGATALLVTQDLGVVAHYCDRVGVMHDGELVEVADVRTFFRRPVHAYSQRLMRSVRGEVEFDDPSAGEADA